MLLDLLVGVAAGIVSGLLGVGGGIVLTPVLHYVVGMPFLDAVALSLCVIAVQSPIGVWRHAQKGAVDWRMGALLVAGGALGVVIGQAIIARVPVTALKLLFGFLLAATAWQLARGRAPIEAKQPHIATIPAVGILAGTISRLLGVGGGIVTVPALAMAGVPVHTAVGTSLVPVFTNAALATAFNLAAGLEWTRGIALAIGAIGGSLLGVQIAHALPAKGLQRVVAAGMVVAALAIVVDAL